MKIDIKEIKKFDVKKGQFLFIELPEDTLMDTFKMTQKRLTEIFGRRGVEVIVSIEGTFKDIKIIEKNNESVDYLEEHVSEAMNNMQNISNLMKMDRDIK